MPEISFNFKNYIKVNEYIKDKYQKREMIKLKIKGEAKHKKDFIVIANIIKKYN